MIQYGEGITELVLVLRGAKKAEAIEQLRKHEVGAGVTKTIHLTLGPGKQLRVVRGYKHLGAMTTAALQFDPEVAARATTASCADAAISGDICTQSKLPGQIRTCKHCGC